MAADELAGVPGTRSSPTLILLVAVMLGSSVVGILVVDTNGMII